MVVRPNFPIIAQGQIFKGYQLKYLICDISNSCYCAYREEEWSDRVKNSKNHLVLPWSVLLDCGQNRIKMVAMTTENVKIT